MSPAERITSRDNRRLVAARKVRDGRERERIFIEGKRLAMEALRSDIEIDESFFADDFQDRELFEAVARRTDAIAELPERLFRSIANTKEPQGIILITKRPESGRHRIAISHGSLPLVVFLNEINNPSNLGAILRTSEAAGVAGVIVSRGSADIFSPKALRAAMGASFRIPIWDDAGFDDVMVWAPEGKFATCAAAARCGQSYTSVDWTYPRLLILGSEAHGLTEKQLGEVDETLIIPMEQGVESLNLAVAAGIILYEARRQNAAG